MPRREGRKITSKNWEGGVVAATSITTTQGLLAQITNAGATPTTVLRVMH